MCEVHVEAEEQSPIIVAADVGPPKTACAIVPSDTLLTMPVRPTLRHSLGFIGLSTLVYLALYLRGGQDSQQYTPPVEGSSDDRIERTTRIIAVGDLHGDIGNAQMVLEMARVVDSYGNWSGDVDVFVQTGDIIDRCVVAVRAHSCNCLTDKWLSGDDTIELFDWMEDLRSQAQGAGGRVMSHLGNHEWMNAIG